MHWTFCLERGAPQRVNHAAVVMGDKIFSFGGYCSEHDTPRFIDCYCFDAHQLKWMKIHYDETRNSPLCCYGHTVVAYQHLIYLWGGQNVHGPTNILYCFNTRTLSWSRPETSGRSPNRTDGHSACVIGDYMYTFGGFEEANNCFSQKTYMLNLITLKWQEAITSDFRPCRRDFHTASAIGKFMYVFGGRSSNDSGTEFYPDQIMCLNTENLRWTAPVTVGPVPCGRRSHSAVVCKEQIYIIAGYNGITEKHLNDVYRYNPATSEWTEMKTLGVPPCARRRHCSLLVGDVIYLFGGTSPDKTSFIGRKVLKEHGDMHMLEFIPTLRRLSQLKTLEYGLDLKTLPISLQKEFKRLISLRLQPIYSQLKRNYTAFSP